MSRMRPRNRRDPLLEFLQQTRLERQRRFNASVTVLAVSVLCLPVVIAIAIIAAQHDAQSYQDQVLNEPTTQLYLNATEGIGTNDTQDSTSSDSTPPAPVTNRYRWWSIDPEVGAIAYDFLDKARAKDVDGMKKDIQQTENARFDVSTQEWSHDEMVLRSEKDILHYWETGDDFMFQVALEDMQNALGGYKP